MTLLTSCISCGVLANTTESSAYNKINNDNNNNKKKKNNLLDQTDNTIYGYNIQNNSQETIVQAKNVATTMATFHTRK